MFTKILVPVDTFDDATTDKLCKAANAIAVQFNAEVRLMTVMPGFGMSIVASYFPEDAQSKLRKELQAKLDVLAETYFTVKLSTKLSQGKRLQEILQEADAWGAEQVIIGCRRKQSLDNQKFLGTCSRGVADRAICSVLIIK